MATLSSLSEEDGVVVVEYSEMVEEVNAGLKKGLKEKNKRASKTPQNKKGNAIVACCFEGVQLLYNTRNSLKC